ncbi:ribonuclease H-like domain-containing protein [Tanacetum coccineum]
MSVHGYTDDEFVIDYPVTLIRTENDQVWSCAMLLALVGKNKTGFIDGSCKRSNIDEVLGPHRVDSGSIAGTSQRSQASAIVSNANITDANQHMTHTNKELDNVHDISHFRIKVGHPNGTEAFISKIENLRLSNGLVLYDVLVIPKYCVTLISVHKLAKDKRFLLPLLEQMFFLNQDLNLKNVLRIGNQCRGLYYFNDQDCKVKYMGGSIFSLEFKNKEEELDLNQANSKSAENIDEIGTRSKVNDGCVDSIPIKIKETYGITMESGMAEKFVTPGIPCTQMDEPAVHATHEHEMSPSNIGEKEMSPSNIGEKEMSTSNIGEIVDIKPRPSDSDLKKIITDVKFFKSIFPFKEIVTQKSYTTSNIFQDLNHINFFDNEYLEIPNDDERVDPSLDSDYKSHSDSSHSSVLGEGVNIDNFLSGNNGNDAQCSDDTFAVHNEQVTTFEDNIVYEGNSDQNSSSSTQGAKI